jgi:hypothetical protein
MRRTQKPGLPDDPLLVWNGRDTDGPPTRRLRNA